MEKENTYSTVTYLIFLINGKTFRYREDYWASGEGTLDHFMETARDTSIFRFRQPCGEMVYIPKKSIVAWEVITHDE